MFDLHGPALSLQIKIILILSFSVSQPQSRTVLHTIRLRINPGTKLLIHTFPLPLPFPCTKISRPPLHLVQPIPEQIRVTNTPSTRPCCIVRLPSGLLPLAISLSYTTTTTRATQEPGPELLPFGV